MNTSVFDIFKIGVGPSSSHTVGPMIAAQKFVQYIADADLLGAAKTVKVELYGSLGATGKGHGTDKAVMLGLEGHLPASIDPDIIEPTLQTIRKEKRLRLLGKHDVRFEEREHIMFYRRLMAGTAVVHPNGMRFQCFDAEQNLLAQKEFYSIGGGFVVNPDGDRVNGLLELARFLILSELATTCCAYVMSRASPLQRSQWQTNPHRAPQSRFETECSIFGARWQRA